MRALLLAVFALLLLAFCVPSAPATAQTTGEAVATPPSTKHPTHHKMRRPRVSPQGQIACTEFGCHPIPPNCHTTTVYTYNGLPTGYDGVACR
ncbi:MAG: hypothetical protein ACRECC_09065 [Pseudolabrys sp.]|jgi:hypothetical protein